MLMIENPLCELGLLRGSKKETNWLILWSIKGDEQSIYGCMNDKCMCIIVAGSGFAEIDHCKDWWRLRGVKSV